MAISKGSTMINSNRFITLEVNQYEHKEIQGVLYHENIKNGRSFNSLIEAMREMEAIFDSMNYPAKSMEARSFLNNSFVPDTRSRGKQEEAKQEPAGHTALATFQICVRKRYNVSWQGYMMWKEQDQIIMFESFLEMIKSINRILGGSEKQPQGIPEEPICRVAVDDYAERRMQGRISYAAKEQEVPFGSIMELVEQMDVLADCLSNQKEEKLPLQICSSYLNQGRAATFLIRLLFLENATWQGMVYWREAGRRINFRSFLELIQIMDATLADVDGLNQIKSNKAVII